MERAELIALVRSAGCAVERTGAVFLCDPDASALERAAIIAAQATANRACAESGEGWLCIKSGGTSGNVKFARHDERTLSAAARGFCDHFGFSRVNAVDVLPAHHVSGLMARVRCAMTGGRHLPWEWKRLEQGDVPRLAGADWLISLVPTQLHRLLSSKASIEWLRQFAAIFIGGGPMWPGLSEAGAQAGLRIAVSYGLTETAAMVTAQRPDDFVAGDRSSGTPLPHAGVTITPEGLVRVTGPSLFRGYWPDIDLSRELVTDDLGSLDERGHLHVLGRCDEMIITGGKKVQPAAVEASLRESGEFDEVVVLGVPDPEWGQAVVACYPANERMVNLERAGAALAAYERPKRYVPVAVWPRNAQGKVSRLALREAVARHVG